MGTWHYDCESIDMNMTLQEYSYFCKCRQMITKEGKSMCKTISKIQGKKADDLLKMSGQEFCVPVDLEKLLKKLSISCEPLDFTEIGDEDNEILGALVTKEDKAVIFYREQDAKDSHRCRFTIAHEIAHACLSEEQVQEFSVHFRREGDINDTEEITANIFAGELLVPERMLNIVIGKLLRPSVKSLSNVFDVSESVIKARLDFLKIKQEIIGYEC